MNILVALVVGYVVGAKSGDEDFEQIRRSLVALYGSDEFADLVSAVRGQAASMLRGLAEVMDDQPSVQVADGDIVARVRHLVGRD